MSRTTAALLLAIALSFIAGRASAAPRSAPVLSRAVGAVEMDRERFGAPSVAASIVPTAPPADRAETSVAMPADDAIVAPKASMPAGLVGIASWYRYVAGQAAAGPRLRELLGPGWRGSIVTVGGLAIRLTDWCQCYQGTATERLIDLDARDFARLAPLARGLVTVEIGR